MDEREGFFRLRVRGVNFWIALDSTEENNHAVLYNNCLQSLNVEEVELAALEDFSETEEESEEEAVSL